MQNATGSLNDTSAADALDATKLSFDVYANITGDALDAITVRALDSCLPCHS